MDRLLSYISANPAVAAAAGLSTLLVAALLYAYRRTLQVRAVEERSLQEDLAKLTALVSSAPKSSPVTALVTGANSGIGFTLSLLLARCGVRVVLGCRSASRGQAAVDRIRAAAGPGSDVRLLIIDVSDPVSIVAAAHRARTDESVGLTSGLSFLFLNAGVMPLSRYRWEVAVQAVLIGGLGHFLTTGRAHAGSAHFLGQPQDEVGACGAPATFATNVLGHLLLVQELAPLLGGGSSSPAPVSAASDVPGSKGKRARSRSTSTSRARAPKPGAVAPAPAASAPVGRVVWTGSRAATEQLFEWKHLAPPSAPGQPSAHQAWLTSGGRYLGEAYGESKFATDLLNVSGIKRRLLVAPAPLTIRTSRHRHSDPASPPSLLPPPLQPALSRRAPFPSVVICPGFIDTEITPPFFKAFIPLLRIVR